MAWWFAYPNSSQHCPVSTVDFSKIDLSKVTTMYSLFSGCNQLNQIIFSQTPTSELTNLNNTFSGSGVTELDLRSFDTSNVTEMWGTFNGCANLQTIYSYDFNIDSLSDLEYDSADMFKDCDSLVGQSGTTVADMLIDDPQFAFTANYAMIDDPDGSGIYGYFTEPA